MLNTEEWREFITRWNNRSDRNSLAHLGNVTFQFSEDLVCLSFDANGIARVEDSVSRGLRFWGTNDAWDTIFDGEKSVVQAIAEGELSFSGDFGMVLPFVEGLATACALAVAVRGEKRNSASELANEHER